MDENIENLIMCTITTDTLPDQLFERLPSSARKRFMDIEWAAHHGDVSYIPKAEEMIKEYPHLPKLYNFLEGLYIINSQKEKACVLTKEMYEKFPEYLFAKIAYAKLCMAEGRVDEFEKIFRGKYNLKLLYPDRDEFHISEFLAFTDVLCLHACHKGNLDFVRQTIKTLKATDLDQGDFLEALEERLHRFENLSLMDRILLKIQKQGARRGVF